MSSDAALLAEIAKLDQAISQARRPQAPPPPSYRPPYKAHPYSTSSSSIPTGSRNKKLIINPSSSKPSAAPSTAPGPSRTSKPLSFPVPTAPSTSATAPGSSTQWVQKTGRHMSLMNAETFEKAEKARLARPPPPIRKPAPTPSSSTGPAPPRQVVIDGTVFEFDASGTKLNKVEGQSDSPNPSRRRHSLFGQDYVRTKSGNLLSAAIVRSRKGRAGGPSAEEMAGKKERLGNMTLVLNGMQKARNDQSGKSSSSVKKPKKPQALCQFYTKTGRCTNAFSCRFIHDPSKLSICPKFLRSTCPHTPTSCPLSHSSSSHNAPSCVHFQTTGSCRAGSDCLYSHVRVADDAPICGDFVKYGWCEKGQEKCGERHVWECKEWTEKGTCRRKGKCGLRHVLKAEKGRVVVEEEGGDGEEGGRRGDEEMEGGEGSTFVVDSVGSGSTSASTGLNHSSASSSKRSGMESLVQQDDFIQFSTFGGSSDEGSASSEEENESDDEDASSVESDGGEEEEEGEDRIGDLVDALMTEQPERSNANEEEEEDSRGGRRGDEEEE
ncbi:hypothetical protein BDY24DRAFT_439654 [Mrakia frigida]|uniref:uncharacterized protein n=1 Tax=Mrakia frigida TaxID=29902 RepID=UPI003FCBEFA7